jgi:hypothetical protein
VEGIWRSRARASIDDHDQRDKLEWNISEAAVVTYGDERPSSRD